MFLILVFTQEIVAFVVADANAVQVPSTLLYILETAVGTLLAIDSTTAVIGPKFGVLYCKDTADPIEESLTILINLPTAVTLVLVPSI